MNSQYEHQSMWTPDLSLLGDKWDLVASQMGLKEGKGNNWKDDRGNVWQLTRQGFEIKNPHKEGRH